MCATICVQSDSALLADASAARLLSFGLGNYDSILRIQERLRERRTRDGVPDTWLVGEHPAVITRGARSGENDVADQRTDGIRLPVYEVDRGGMTTLHGPGQLVVYPIVKPRGGSLAAGRLARALLVTMQRWVEGEFGVRASIPRRRPGLFVDGRKLLSIGISVRRGVSMHGVALNLCNDPSLWKAIIACGDPAARPVSMSEILGRYVRPAEQVDSICRWLTSQWEYERVDLLTTNDSG